MSGVCINLHFPPPPPLTNSIYSVIIGRFPFRDLFAVIYEFTSLGFISNNPSRSYAPKFGLFIIRPGPRPCRVRPRSVTVKATVSIESVFRFWKNLRYRSNLKRTFYTRNAYGELFTETRDIYRFESNEFGNIVGRSVKQTRSNGF